MLDKLPAWARHLVLVVLVPAVMAAVQVVWGVLQNSGLNGIQAMNWGDVWKAFIGALLVAGAAWITPLTHQYGVGSAPVDPPADPPAGG